MSRPFDSGIQQPHEKKDVYVALNPRVQDVFPLYLQEEV